MFIAKTSLSFAAFFTLIALGGAAHAQGAPTQKAATPAAPAASAASTQTTTSEYSETRTEGSAVVKFKEDIVGAGSGAPLGEMMMKPASPIRFLLIRPRFNFVSELQKSVENM